MKLHENPRSLGAGNKGENMTVRVTGIIDLTGNFRLRQMNESDISQVMGIENSSFANPWSKSSFLRELIMPASSFLVAVRDEFVVGYMGYWLIEDEAQIMNVAVHLEYRRKGIANKILKYVIGMIFESGVKNVYLEVRKGNAAARVLYNKLGFKEIGVRKQYYEEEKEDAVLMRKKLFDAGNTTLESPGGLL